MPLQTKCKKCGRDYTVPDELAGKRFRCKQCQAAVSVPQPAILVEEEVFEEPEDLFGGFDESDFEDDTTGDDWNDIGLDDFESDYEAPQPKARKPKKRPKKSSTKRKRRRKKPNPLLGIGKVVGIGAAILIGLVLFLGILGTVVKNSGGIEVFTTWKSYTTPDGNLTVLMPGDAKPVPTMNFGARSSGYGVAKRNYVCAVVIEPMPPNVVGMSENEIFDAFEFGSGMIGATDVERTQINGKQCVRFNRNPTAKIKTSNVAFVHNNKLYTLNYGYKTVKGSAEKKFFNSVKFN